MREGVRSKVCLRFEEHMTPPLGGAAVNNKKPPLGFVSFLRRSLALCCLLALLAVLSSAAHADDFTWTGVVSSDWNTAGNWTTTGTSGRLFPNNAADTATFPTPATAQLTANISSSVTVNTITFNATGYTISATSGQTLTLGGTTPTIAVSSDTTTTPATPFNATISSVIAGSAGLTKSGDGVLILSGVNTYTGSTFLNQGQITARNTTASPLSTGALNMADGTTLRLENVGSSGTFLSNTIAVASTASSVTMTSSSASNGYGGAVTGGNANTNFIIGGGTQVSFNNASGTQQFSGFAGTVQIGTGQSLRYSATTGANNGGANTTFNVIGNVVARNAGTAHFGALTGTGAISGAASGAGTVTEIIGEKGTDSTFGGTINNGGFAPSQPVVVQKLGTGTLTLTGANTYTGATTVSAGTLKIGNSLALGAAGTTPLSFTVTAGAVTAATSGNANTTTVSSGATLDLNGQFATSDNINLSGTGVGGNGVLINSGASATVGGGVNSISITNPGTGYTSVPTVAFSAAPTGGTTATGTATLGVVSATVSNGGSGYGTTAPTVTFSAPASGGRTAAGTAVLSAGGSVTSITITDPGFGYTSTPTITFGGTGGAIATANLGVVGIAPTNRGSGYNSAPTITIAAPTTGTTATVTTTVSTTILAANSTIGGTGDITLAGVVSGTNFGLTKISSNTLFLNGTNTYTGATTVSGGALGGTGNIGGSGSTTAVTFQANTTHSPGVSGPGSQTVNAGSTAATGYILSSASNLAVDLNGTTAGTNYDQVNVNGAVVLTGSNLVITLGFTPTANQTFTLINNDGTDAVTGTFTQGNSITVGGTTFGINYAGGTGNDVVLTALPAASGITAYAVAGSTLYSFDLSRPAVTTVVGTITGPGGAFAPEGIDFNPASGVLYALDIGATTSQLYTINTSTAAATAVGAGFSNTGSGNNGAATPVTSSYDLTGQNIGFDFNPKTLQPDGSIRIRVTAQNGSNIRLNSSTGAVANVDIPLNVGGTTTSIVASAYTNNLAQLATSGQTTTLYDVSDTNDTLYTQNPPNNGTLMPVGVVLGIDAKSDAGLDILTNGSTNTAYLSTDAAATAGTEFYTVDLTPTTGGAATLVGNFTVAVTDIAIPAGPNPDVTAPTVSSIVRQTGSTNPTTSGPVVFTVTFSEAVVGVDATDFTLTTTDTISGATIGVTGSGATYTVTVSGFTGTGTIRLDVTDDDTIRDFANNRLGGTGTGNGNFTTGETFTINSSAVVGSVLISQFRLSGLSGDSDEFIELYNNTGAAIDLSTYSVQADGTALTGLNLTGKSIPARGHLLITNSTGYSLDGTHGGVAYSNGAGGVATGDATYTGNIASTAVVTLNSAGTAVDSVNTTGTLNNATTTQYAFVRRSDTGVPQDTNTDATDFNLVSISSPQSTVDGTGVGPLNGARLGAPGPRNSSSPIQRNSLVAFSVPAGITNPAAKYASTSTNFNNAAANSSGGQLSLRRTVTNNTGATVTQLRFRLVGGTLGSNTAGVADLRAISSKAPSTPFTAPGGVIVNGLRLEAPSDGAGQGGGVNSSWATVDLTTTALILANGTAGTPGGLKAGEAATFEFLFAINSPGNGNYRFAIDAELLP